MPETAGSLTVPRLGLPASAGMAAPGHHPGPGSSRPGLPPAPVRVGVSGSRAQRWFTVLDGHRLRELRREQGLSREKLADRAGVSIATVARLERQPRSSCRTRTTARLAAALGEQPAALACPEPDRPAADASPSAAAARAVGKKHGPAPLTTTVASRPAAAGESAGRR